MLAGALALLVSMAAPGHAKPLTIPALREWQPTPGGFELRRSSRVVVADPRLAPDAKLFARELKRSFVAGVAAGPGDIELALGSRDRKLGSEGYTLDVGAALRIEALTTTGAYHGTRTVLQLLRRGRTIPGGRARDWPRYPERGLMLDNGRRYFSPAWIKRQIRLLAYLKLNQLHLHFSDNEGFRIESESHPEIVSARHLTKRQVREIVEFARRRHVRVIPELDMPGHLRAALADHPELRLRDHADKLDISLPAARRFCRDLILEYLELFPGRYWHAGADEYLSTAGESYIDFINWIDRLVRAHGRTLRIWHDGLSGTRLNRDVVVEWWADHAGPTPEQLLVQGHRVLNAGWWPTYYVAGGPFGKVQPSMRVAYDKWQVNLFGGLALNSATAPRPPQRVPARSRALLGSELHVWNDVPWNGSVDETAREIAPRLAVLAQKTWDTPPPARAYAGFLRLWGQLTPPTGTRPSRRR
jgi:hexosaminidase